MHKMADNLQSGHHVKDMLSGESKPKGQVNKSGNTREDESLTSTYQDVVTEDDHNPNNNDIINNQT